jgi:hypothetical protein
LIIGDVRGTFELSSCYNVTIDCRSSDMVATITTNKIFTGKIYAKENPNSCVVDVKVPYALQRRIQIMNSQTSNCAALFLISIIFIYL